MIAVQCGQCRPREMSGNREGWVDGMMLAWWSGPSQPKVFPVLGLVAQDRSEEPCGILMERMVWGRFWRAYLAIQKTIGLFPLWLISQHRFFTINVTWKISLHNNAWISLAISRMTQLCVFKELTLFLEKLVVSKRNLMTKHHQMERPLCCPPEAIRDQWFWKK